VGGSGRIRLRRPSGSKEVLLSPGENERSAQRQTPVCAWCGAPAALEVLLVCARQIRAQLAICNADAVALALGEWEISIRCMDRKVVVRGRDLASCAGAHEGTPPL
jgi:hypothetical protein